MFKQYIRLQAYCKKTKGVISGPSKSRSRVERKKRRRIILY